MSKNLLAILVLLVTNFALAGGNGSGGGDTACEDRLQIVRDQFKFWLNNPKTDFSKLGLKIPVSEYRSQMIDKIKSAHLSCTKALPNNGSELIQVDGIAKACRFDTVSCPALGNNSDLPNEVKNNASKLCKAQPTKALDYITCQFDRVINSDGELAIKPDDLYPLIHHEYAGIAGIESPRGDRSYYTFSNHISAYVFSHVVFDLSPVALASSQAQNTHSVPLSSPDYKGVYMSNTATQCSVSQYLNNGTWETQDYYVGISGDLSVFTVSLTQTDHLAARITRTVDDGGWSALKVELLDESGAILKREAAKPNESVSISLANLPGGINSVDVKCDLPIYHSP